MKKIIFLIILINISLKAHKVVDNLNLEKFMGKWYVISLIPNYFEKGAENAYDYYELNDDGTIDITYKATRNGKIKTLRQKGTVSSESNAKWKIKFLKPFIPFFKAPYEVIILDSDYTYMAVGYPNNDYGWIMARDTVIKDSLYNEIIEKLDKNFNYPKGSFKKVIHNYKIK